jgi:lysophospholipase L1-like esterase
MGRGGVTGSGGAPSTGGATGRGGVTGSGGAPGTGGAPGSGGTTGNGGAADGGSRDGGPTARDAADPNTPDAGEGGFDPCPATGNCKILPLGDSITAGAGAQPGDNGGYRVELFTKAVNDNRHITFVGSLSSGPSTVAGATFPKNHEGHIGWTITQINNVATTAQTVSVSGTSSAGALRDTPNVVLLFIGTNDEGYASSEAGASDRLATLIDKIVAALPNALLVVSSIYPFPGCQSTNYTPTQCAANVATYDAAIPGIIQQRVAQGKHVLFVDMSTPPTGALSTDGVHPNDTVGYPWMGDNWYTAIKSYLH